MKHIYIKRIYLVFLLLILFLITYPVFSDYISQVTQPSGVVIPVLKNLQEGNNLTSLRVMTFNIHHGVAPNGKGILEEIAQIIKNTNADVVGLNEVDLFLPRTGFINQIKVLAQRTNMNYLFAPTLHLLLGQYGNGVLSKLPINNPIMEPLPSLGKMEPRGLLRFWIKLAGRNVQIIVTHLSLNPVEREKQLEYLAVLIKKIKEPIIVMGDFNTTPTTRVMKDFIKKTGINVHSFEPTYPATEPDLKIDYILTSNHWTVEEEVTVLPIIISDHLPVIGTFRLK